MLETVRLHELMTEHAMRCGIGHKTWSKLLNNCEKWTEERKDFVRTFIRKLHENEWKAFDSSRKQMCATDEMWENMDLFFEHEAFPEQVIVKKSMRMMKERWVRFKDDYKSLLMQLKHES